MATEFSESRISALAAADAAVLVDTNTADLNTILGEFTGYADQSGTLAQFAATTSLQLLGVISDETGTGALVFANSPTLITPALGTPSALVGTNITGTAAGLTVGATTGVEAGADVTDVANVTAAGALMDSELTAIASIKALDQGVATTDNPQFATIELGHATDTTLSRVSAGLVAIEGVNILTVGATIYEEILIPAGAFVPRGTNTASAGVSSSTTNDVTVDHFAFDSITEEGVQFPIPLPDSWDLGTIKFEYEWDGDTGASASDGVTWGGAAQSWDNDDVYDTAFPASIDTDDTLIAVLDSHKIKSAAITVGGTPAKGHTVYAEVTRVVGDANDDMAEDALLKFVRVQFGRIISNSTAW